MDSRRRNYATIWDQMQARDTTIGTGWWLPVYTQKQTPCKSWTIHSRVDAHLRHRNDFNPAMLCALILDFKSM
eukprot:221475-Chlamydomonas_euryale.AAC.8